MMHHYPENIPNFLDIKQTMIKHIAQFMYHYDKNKLPKVFTECFSTCSSTKMHLTRKSQLISDCITTSVGQQSVMALKYGIKFHLV